MRNKIFGKKLARNRKSREALFVSLVTNVIEHGEMTTTLTKAKAIQAELDRLMLDVAQGDVAGRRHAAAFLRNNRATVDKLFELKDLAKSRKSGFSSIMRLPTRRGDNAEMAKITWVAVANTETSEKNAKQESEPSQTSSNA